MKKEFLFIIGLLLLLGQGSKAMAQREEVAPSGPAPILDVQWYGVDTTGEEAQSVLVVRIENVSDSPWTVDVSVECMGLIQHAAELDLGVVEIAADEAIYLEVYAADLPLQSQDYIMQVRVNAEVEWERSRMDPVIRPTYSEYLFYRHADERVRKVHTFSEEILSVVYGGRLAPEEPTRGEIGWVMGERGYLEPVYATDFPFLDDNERVIAYYYGATAIHSGKSGGFGNTIPYEHPNPFAAPEIKFCTEWLTGYIDAYFGEDLLVIPSWDDPCYRFVPASYAKVKVLHENGTHIWDGYLDVDGCTPYLPVESFTYYTIEQWTDMEKDSGTTSEKKITVLQDAADVWEDEDWAEIVYSWVGFGGISWPSQNTIHITPMLSTRGTHVAPVAALVLENSDKMAYPDLMETYISTKLGGVLGCTGTYYALGNKVCVVDDRPYWKYVIAHEMGHRVGYGQYAWWVGSYDEYNTSAYSTDHHCNCDHIDPASNNGKGQWHCLQSREEIKTAQGEGWAQAYATMLFNHQGSTSGADAAFVYYKAKNDIFLVFPPLYVNAKYQIRRMETYCNDAIVDRGTEQDWLVFFTTVWQDTTNRFSAAELIDVSYFWNPPLFTSYWSELVDNVGGIYGPLNDKTIHFTDTGFSAGVDH